MNMKHFRRPGANQINHPLFASGEPLAQAGASAGQSGRAPGSTGQTAGSGFQPGEILKDGINS